MKDSVENSLENISIEDSIESQEECLSAVYNGRFREAGAFYRRTLERDPQNVALIIDYAKMLYRQCHYGACSAYISEKRSSGIIFSPQETQIISIINNAALVYSQGTLRSALKQAREARQILRAKPMEKFGDEEVDLVEYSLRIMKNVHYRSNWLYIEDRIFPSSDSANTEWIGYNTWQGILRKRGKYWQALTILNLTDTLLPPATVTAGFNDIISCCQQDQGISTKLLVLAATVSACRFSITCSNFVRGREFLKKAELLAQELPTRYKSASGSNIVLDLEIASIEAYPKSNTIERARQYERLAQRARDIHNFGRADAWFTTASELALQASAWAEFSEWRKENERIQAEVMQDLPSLLIGRSRHWRFGGGRDLAKLIEWYDNFDAAHPSSQLLDSPEACTDIDLFDIPIALHTKETSKRIIFGRLGDEKSLERRQQSEALLQELQKHLPDHSISSNIEPYLRDFSKIDARDTYGPLKVLINRVTEALSNGSIEQDLAANLLALPHASSEQIQNITPKDLYDSFFTNSGSLRWPKYLASIKTFLEQDCSAIETGAGSYLLVRLQQLRTSTVTEVAEVEQENEVFLDLIVSCKEDVHKIFRRNELNSKSIIALCKLEKVKIKEIKNFPPVQASEYDEIIQIYNECLEAYQEPSLSRQLGEIALLYVQLADTCQRRRRLFNTPTIAEIEEHLSAAEAVFDELRQDLAALKNSSALIGKTGFSASVPGAAKLREVAYRTYRRELLVNASDTAAKVKLWNWVQKSKGRALTDVMGFSARIPAELIKRVNSDNHHRQKLAEWDVVNLELKEALQRSPSPDNANEIYYLRVRRKNLKLEMLAIDSLADIINLVEGGAIQYDEVGSLLSMAQKMDNEIGKAIALVDWFYVTNIWGGRDLYCFVIRGSRGAETNITLNLFPLGAAQAPVNKWITSNLQKTGADLVPNQASFQVAAPTSSRAFAELQELKVIIQPLKATTQPGDTLILCPTESMHRLPLHAMYLPSPDDEKLILIKRNPVLYCHSLSIFRFCVFSHLESLESSSTPSLIAPGFFPLDRKALEGIDDEKLKRKAKKALRTEILEEKGVTQTAFYENTEQAKCVFFLGHVHDAGSTPLESHLVLYEEPDQERKHCYHSDTDIVKASAILEKVHLSRGAHVILISCASGVSYSKATDEFLGIVPAFIYSGARSTVSTLWPIEKLAGIEFGKSYIDNWMKRRKGSGIANLAKCMQDAILELISVYTEEEVEENLATWAAFVFHGYWMHSYAAVSITKGAKEAQQ